MKEIHRLAKLNASGHAANAVLITDSGGFVVTSGTVNVNELNMLNNARSNLQTQIDKCTAGNYSMPEYTTLTEIAVSTFYTGYTAPSNGILYLNVKLSDSYSYRIFINEKTMYKQQARSYGGHLDNLWFLVPKNAVIQCEAPRSSGVLLLAWFFPLVTA